MTTPNSQFIGVDLGGSSIKLGKFNQKGDLIAGQVIPTPQPSVPGVVTIAICDAIQSLDPLHQSSYVGIGLPGPIDSLGRLAKACINLPGWTEVPLADWLEPRLNRKVTLGNDGNCALLGEVWKGSAIGSSDVVLITLGTGVGGGVMLNGKLFSGSNGAAAEPGLICIDQKGPICNSGNNGSLEQFGSVSGLKRLSKFSPIELNHLANLGDAEALSVWKEYGKNLGVGISSLIYLFTPQLVLIGGGLSASAAHFLPHVQNEVDKRVHPTSREGVIIRKCALGNEAGCMGAAKLAMQRFLNLMPTYKA